MKRPTEQPWWVNATDLPPWFGEFEKAWVEAGICDWTGGRDPHPQEPAMFAWWWFKTHSEAQLIDGGVGTPQWDAECIEFGCHGGGADG